MDTSRVCAKKYNIAVKRCYMFRAVLVIGVLAAACAAGQTSGQTPGQAKSWTPPRTPDGQPDLQGLWTNATLTPLERPTDLAGKQFLTEQEAKEFAKRALNDVDADRRDGGGVTDVNRAYNEFWRERGNVTPDRRTSLIVDPPDGRVPALTPQAQKLVAARADAAKLHPGDGPEDRSLAERCLVMGNGGPPMLPSNYSSNYRIVQNPNFVAILVEQIHDARIIPLDGRPHISADLRQWMGDSRGHWEGNTLVVETTNFTDKTNFRGSGEHMKLIERFTRTGPDSIMYEFTVNDPESFTKSWTARIPMAKTTGPLLEYACNEGNYAMSGILAGLRAEEKKSK